MRDKFEAGFHILDRWLALWQHSESLVSYFEDNCLQKVAVYGMGSLGERLIDELDGTPVQVLYAIDRAAEQKKYSDMKIYGVQEILYPPVDAICVTPVQAYWEVVEQLSGRTEAPVISLEDAVIYCDLKMRGQSH